MEEYIQYDSIYIRLKNRQNETILLRDGATSCKTAQEGKKWIPQNLGGVLVHKLALHPEGKER